MKKVKTAFNKEHNYRDYADEGKRIGQARDQKVILEHLNHMLDGEKLTAQRSAAITQHCSDIDIRLYESHIPILLKILDAPPHPACPRAVFRIFERLQIPEELIGSVIDISFKYLYDPNTAVASIAFALGTISKHLKTYPDLANELIAIMRALYPRGTPGVKSKIRAVVKAHQLKDVY